MNRGVITISESGTVSMPTDTVWMTMQEIADMYNVFGCYVRKAVKAIFKDGILKEQGVRRHVRKNDRISYDVYSLELVIAVAFRIDSIESRSFRGSSCSPSSAGRQAALNWSVSLQRMQWHRPAIKQRSLEALRLQPLGRTTAVCFSMVLDFIQTIRRTLGKHDLLGIANKTRRQPITATLGKLYVVALFISHTHQGHSPTHLSFCTLHDS